MSRLFGILLVVFLGLAGVLTTVSQECPRLTLKAKARPNAKRGILAGKGRARITVTLSSKDPVDNLEFQLKLPNGLSVERTTMRPSSKPSVPLQIVEDSDGTSTIYWLGIAFTKRKGGKLRFRVKVKADECAPETLAVDAFAYLVNATAASCITPLVNAAIVKVRYSKLDKAATCAPTPAPSINPTQPFVLFGAGQRFSQGGRLAPFQNRRLSARSGMNTQGALAALSQPRDRHLQSIDTPEACYEYCSLNAGEETPFFFSWNIVTRQCFCCVAVCTPFVFDPDSNVYEALLPKTLPPVSMPTAAPTLAPSMTPTAAPTTAPTASPTPAPSLTPSMTPTAAPTPVPTASPTAAPTLAPTMSRGGVSWAQSFGGTDFNRGNGIAVDASGSSYTTGYFEGTMTVGNTTLTSAGSGDIFTIKLDPDGNPVWAQSFGSTNFDQGNGIGLDASGSSYTTGYFQGTMTVGNTTLTAPLRDIFMIKLDPDGNPVWAQSFRGTNFDQGSGIAVDASGSSYTTGYFADTLTVGNTTLTSASPAIKDIFMIKLDPDGNPVWAQSFGGTDNDEGFGIGVDASGSSYTTGSFRGNMTVGNSTLTSTGNNDIFMIKLDPDGNPVWAQGFGGSGGDVGNGITVDASGSSYTTGYFRATMTVGSTTLTSAGSADIFMIKLDPDGHPLWAQSFGGTDFDAGNGVGLDASGSSYTTGSFQGTMTVGPTTLTSAGSRDIFMIKLDPDGNPVRAQGFGGTDSDQGYGIAVDASGSSYTTGSFRGNMTVGNSTLTTAGFEDIFMIKLDP